MQKYFDRFKQLPTWSLTCYLIAKMLAGMGIGILIAQHHARVTTWGWWVILASLILALPAKFKMIQVYRTMSTGIIVLAMFAAALFGAGLGLIFIDKLSLYGWWFVGAAVVLSIPGAFKIFSNK